jgi:hypothetical protein
MGGYPIAPGNLPENSALNFFCKPPMSFVFAFRHALEGRGGEFQCLMLLAKYHPFE